MIDAATRRTHVFREPYKSRAAGEAAGSGYAHESSLEPHESLSCAAVVYNFCDLPEIIRNSLTAHRARRRTESPMTKE